MHTRTSQLNMESSPCGQGASGGPGRECDSVVSNNLTALAVTAGCVARCHRRHHAWMNDGNGDADADADVVVDIGKE